MELALGMKHSVLGFAWREGSVARDGSQGDEGEMLGWAVSRWGDDTHGMVPANPIGPAPRFLAEFDSFSHHNVQLGANRIFYFAASEKSVGLELQKAGTSNNSENVGKLAIAESSE